MKILFVETLIEYDGPYLILGINCTKGQKIKDILLSIRCSSEGEEYFLSVMIGDNDLRGLKDGSVDINKLFRCAPFLYKGWFDLEDCNFMLESHEYKLSPKEVGFFKNELFLKEKDS